MKQTLLIAALALGIVNSLFACHSERDNSRAHREYVSWISFCAARGYNPESRTYDIDNEYMDTWVGSVAEEKALEKAGIKY